MPKLTFVVEMTDLKVKISYFSSSRHREFYLLRIKTKQHDTA